MENWITPEFITSIAWPAVVLFAIVALGMTGQAGKILGNFIISADKIEKLKEIASEHKVAIANFQNSITDAQAMMEQVAVSSSELKALKSELEFVKELPAQLKEVAELKTEFKSDITNLQSGLDRLQVLVTKINVDEARVEELQEEARSSDSDQNRLEEKVEVDLEHQKSKAAVDANWNMFVGQFEEFFNRGNQRVNFDRRSVGTMAWNLVDERRKNKLTDDQAHRIDEVFAEVKSIRYQSVLQSKNIEELEQLKYSIQALSSYLN